MINKLLGSDTSDRGVKNGNGKYKSLQIKSVICVTVYL